MLTDGEVFKKFIEQKGLNDTDVANILKVTSQQVSNFYKSRKFQRPSLKKIVEGFPDFLLNNVNSDTTTEVVKPEGNLTKSGTNKRKASALIPFYNADFIAGVAEELYDDATIYPEYYMDVPEFYGCTAFRAYSDSMEKLIRSGSILFGVKIEDWQSHIEYGQIYGITTTDKRRYLKYIRKSAEDHKKYFLLKSENDDYDDFELPKEKIKNIWLIEGWLDKRT